MDRVIHVLDLFCEQLFGQRCDQGVCICGPGDVAVNGKVNCLEGAVHRGIRSQDEYHAAGIYLPHGTNHVEAVTFGFEVQIAKKQVEFSRSYFVQGVRYGRRYRNRISVLSQDGRQSFTDGGFVIHDQNALSAEEGSEPRPSCCC